MIIKVFCFASILALISLPGCTKKEGTTAEVSGVDPSLAESVTAGEIVYKQYCLTCHQADGGGAARMNPTLVNTSYILGGPDQLVPIILTGMSNQEIDGVAYHNVMPPFDFLTNKEIADVLTYVRNSFGNTAPLITETEVKTIRSQEPGVRSQE